MRYTDWEARNAKETPMDDPFPAGMMPDIEKFFREIHPTLKPGQDLYEEIFATDYFFPLQRKRELVQMMQIARSVNGGDDASS